MQTIGVPKSRKPKFDLTFRILDLNNIPYIAGQVYVKWHVSHAEKHDDRTPKSPIKDHKAFFDYTKTLSVKLLIDKNNWLQESILTLEIIHEVQDRGKGDRSLLGVVKINLAEYVEVSRTSTEPVTRRYLLHESKINSTIKVCVRLEQTDGERNFMAPQLRSAPQFVGIAGVLASDPIASEPSSGPLLPTLDPDLKEAGDELRELYKKTLAAELTSQPGDPSADQVIEDIFGGGDGWGGSGGKGDNSDTASSRRTGGEDGGGGNWSDQETQQHELRVPRFTGNKKSWPDFHARRSGQQLQHHGYGKYGSGPSGSRESLNKADERANARRSHHHLRANPDHVEQVPDVDELEVREDLKCWNSRPMH